MYSDNFTHSILRMDDVHFFILLGFSIFFVIICFMRTFKYRKLARIISDTPTSKIRSAAQGYVELQGVVKPITKSILAPLTQKPCVWYSYTIEEEQSTGRSTEWVMIDHHSSCHLFYLEDETGHVAVYPLASEVTIKNRDRWYTNGIGSSSGGLLGVSLLSSVASSLTGSRYRYTERRIEEGESITALGFFHTCRAAETPFDSGYINQHRDQLLKEKSSKLSQHKALAGIMNALTAHASEVIAHPENEWKTVVEQHPQPQVNVLHKKDRPFMLSSFSEKKMMRRYNWYSFFFSLGFLASTGFSTFLIATRFF
jgi:hypothetical protein